MIPAAAQEVAPESRTERATITLTPSEKAAIRLVATVDRTDESNLLREQTIADILVRAEEIRRKLEEA